MSAISASVVPIRESRGLFDEFCTALDDEILASRKQLKPFYLTDGKYIGHCSDGELYSFQADSEIRIPDESRIELEVHKVAYPGALPAGEGFTALLRLEDFVGERVDSARLRSAPWFLLRDLKTRLRDAELGLAANRELAMAAINGAVRECSKDLLSAMRLLDKLRKNGAEIRANRRQEDAIALVLGSAVSYIWGPPGTGKTSTLGAAVGTLATRDESVLVAAHSNAAVDVAAVQIAKSLRGSELLRDGLVVRVGPSHLPEARQTKEIQIEEIVRRTNPGLIQQLTDLKEVRKRLVNHSRSTSLSARESETVTQLLDQTRQQIANRQNELIQLSETIVRNAKVVCATLSKAVISKLIFERRFDTVIVDEGSMAYIPSVFFAATLAKRAAAVFGDFRQLAPIAQADTDLARKWLSRDVFESAEVIRAVNADRPPRNLSLLDTQYRMHPRIRRVVDELIYKGKLKDEPTNETSSSHIVARAPKAGLPIILVDTRSLYQVCRSDKESYSPFNLAEACLTIEIAKEAIDAGEKSLGIITPYAAQSRLIHKLLHDTGLDSAGVIVSTVHKFQGSERDTILFSCVDSYPRKKPSKLMDGYFESGAMRLLNVATSRAKGKFIFVSNAGFFESMLPANAMVRRWIEHLKSDIVADQPRFSPSWGPLWGIGLPNIKSRLSEKVGNSELVQAIDGAKDQVALAWSRSDSLSAAIVNSLHYAGERGCAIFVGGVTNRGALIGHIKNLQLTDATGEPERLLALDRKLCFLLGDSKHKHGALRIETPATVRLLLELMSVVPVSERTDSFTDRAAPGKSPLGIKCSACGSSAMWPCETDFGIALRCAEKHCKKTQRFTENTATEFAALMGLTCNLCDGRMVGKRGDRGIFLACGNYPKCRSSKALRNLV